MRFTFLLIICLPFLSFAQTQSQNRLIGNWKGIEMYQDENTYDGKNFFLPNEEFMIIDKNRIRVYFYPYSKSDEFEVAIKVDEIVYEMGNKKLETEYKFTSASCDTVVFTMHFINKSFVKMYSRVTSTNSQMEVDFATINELDEYGFNPSAITAVFEIDTFHTDLYRGYTSFDSLDFDAYRYLQFKDDKTLKVNKRDAISIERGYQRIRFNLDGREEEFKIAHSEGTQSFSIIPTSLCKCDSIIIPYLTVDWANRIRKDMKENPYKYR